jgi:predicted transcriptional regulator
MHSFARTQDMPTLRLWTLRKLLAHTPPPLVFDQASPIGVIADALAETRNALAVLVDPAQNFRGILSHELVARGERTTPADQVMTTRTTVMEPEADVEAAVAMIREYELDHVLVVTANGRLLGVLSRGDLEAAGRPSFRR